MEKKTGINGKAIVSVVLGGLAFITPLIGIILAIAGIFTSRIAKKEIVKTDMSVRGIELTTLGLVICIAGMVYQTYHTFNFFML